MKNKYIISRAVALLMILAMFMCGCGNKDAATNSSAAESQGALTDGSQSSQAGESQSYGGETKEDAEKETEAVKESEAITVGTMSPEQVGGYTVTDPDNSRGLSTASSGWGFGAAKDGKPHQISINNQKRLDSLKEKNIQALALDTKTTEKILYLTFDCGYEYNDNTSKILNVLKEKNVKAGFFCTLPFVEGHSGTVERMITEGHVVGNHSTTHPVFTKLTRTQMAEEIWGVHKAIKSKFGYTPKYFRFPTGANSECSLELVTSMGYRSVFWSVAHTDWDTANQPSYETAFNTVTQRLHPGAVILLHTVSDTNVAILGDVIDWAQKNGYTFKTLDEYAWE